MMQQPIEWPDTFVSVGSRICPNCGVTYDPGPHVMATCGWCDPRNPDPSRFNALDRLDDAMRVRLHSEGGFSVDLMASEDGGLGLTPPMSEEAANRWRQIFLATFRKVMS